MGNNYWNIWNLFHKYHIYGSTKKINQGTEINKLEDHNLLMTNKTQRYQDPPEDYHTSYFSCFNLSFKEHYPFPINYHLPHKNTKQKICNLCTSKTHFRRTTIPFDFFNYISTIGCIVDEVVNLFQLFFPTTCPQNNQYQQKRKPLKPFYVHLLKNFK